MSSNVTCYLRTHRRKWGLTQAELASLLPRGDRHRVSCVERALTPPNAEEILAYSLIFGSSPLALFPKYATTIDDAVMRGAYKLYQRMERAKTARAARICDLIDHVRDRALKDANRSRA